MLGFAASVSDGLVPPLPGAAVVWLHVVLFVLGVGAAWVGAVRGREVDAERFAYAADPHATREEVAEAHREAERSHRVSHTALVLAPLLLGYWLAYELPSELPWARALPVSPGLGFGVGFLLARRSPRSGD